MSETYGCGQSACAQLTLGKPGALSWKPLSHCKEGERGKGGGESGRGAEVSCACVRCVRALRAFRLPSRNYPSRAPILPPIAATSPSVPH